MDVNIAVGVLFIVLILNIRGSGILSAHCW